ncbi:MAG: XRE family transcriptional regulator [Acidobacteria bacterium RIFCSPLOWO2_02_FULL_68_18]|nr:MAG: XRE family transcriptional regulator [Acidobacteria bacterium RIFCSPLOWO2_02_FULL_68_18]OFW48184.1 MAG: XRE family transcriptional regulator [Acidobacteria bacterium RIFCSPLOWO2_12_FULL_68_19]
MTAQPALFTPALPPRAEMERAFLESDPTYDGIFLTGVRTTGIFCRPSCRARKPLAANVEYFATVREAIFAGYRPCRRCDPAAPPGTVPGWVKTLLDTVEADPSRRLRDEDLRALGVDPARARRYFLEHYGMTFHAYCRGRRLSGALGQLRSGESLDEVALGTGWESHSGFREAFTRTFGTAPGAARALPDAAIVMATVETPLGPLVAGATDAGLCLLEFTDRRMLEAQMRRLQSLLKQPLVPGNHPYLAQAREELARYFDRTLTAFTLPLVFRGTPFEERVWRELCRIPYGRTISYAELASRVGSPGAQRAVGRANGMNRIAIVIPCHRVVNSDGKLGGYGGGLWRKHWLLGLESGGSAAR